MGNVGKKNASKNDEKLAKIGINLKCVAADYGNLGLNNMLRGDLQKAEEMYKKSLAIHKRLANKEGIAVNFMNLGEVCKQRGDIEMTKGYWEKGLGLYNKIGMPHMVKKVEELIRGIDTE